MLRVMHIASSLAMSWRLQALGMPAGIKDGGKAVREPAESCHTRTRSSQTRQS